MTLTTPLHNDRDDWDSHWDRFALSAERNPAQRMRHALVANLLRRHMDPGQARLLDIGSGQGDLLFRLGSLGPWSGMLGVEMSRSGVEISRKKVPGANFVVADLFQSPEELKAYFGWASAAVCCEVLEHVDAPEELLRAARPLLADRAWLIVTVPSGPMSAFDRHIGHRRHFTKASIGDVLHRAGFEVQSTHLSGFPFFNLYRRLVIARGKKLITDVDDTLAGGSSRLARAAMAGFRGLFRFNLTDSPWGWQIVAVARKN
jgi:SAM-dependent methyltransferase